MTNAHADSEMLL